MASISSPFLQFCMTIQLPSTSYTRNHHFSVNLRPFPSRLSVITYARRRSIPSSKKKKPGLQRTSFGKDEDIEEDAFEALFKQLEEDLKNDGLLLDDDDDDDDEISEEDLVKLERELEEALAEDELIGLFDDVTGDEVEEVKQKETLNKKGTMVNHVIEKEIEINKLEEDDDTDVIEVECELEDGDEDENEDEEGPLELKRWQLRRLAYALKDGRRKTSIKNLAADLCLDRAIVLELLRDPPPDLLMLSASLPDKEVSKILKPVINPEDAALLASERAALNSKTFRKVPVHEMQSNWSAQKRLKKVHVETLERVYRRSKRPTVSFHALYVIADVSEELYVFTDWLYPLLPLGKWGLLLDRQLPENAMISNIVHVTKIPRKKVLKWFEDKRGEDGVPDHRPPYQRDTEEAENGTKVSQADATEVEHVI